jgi:hypothetical protein
MSLEATIQALIVVQEKNTDALERLLAGREDALEQLKNAASPAATGTRSRAKKVDTVAETVVENGAAAAATTAATASVETKTVARPVDATNDELKARIAAWLGTDPAQQAERKPQLAALLAQLGSPAVAGEKSTITDEQRYHATFYVERFKAGLPVDFGADYDFDGDPLNQDAPAADEEPAAAEEEDMLG